MAKGALFTVFADSAPAGSAGSTSSSAASGNVNKPRRALGASSASNHHRALPVFSDENHVTSSWKGKENFDPFAPTVLSAKALGKKPTASDCSSLRAPAPLKALAPKPRPFKLGPAPPSATNGVGSGTLQHASASAGICTGTVRLRTVPSATWGGRSPKMSTTAGAKARTVDMRPKARPAAFKVIADVVEASCPSPSPSESSVMSRASSKDSGYASAARSIADEEEEMSEDEAENRLPAQQSDASPMKKAPVCCAGPETVGDRRARGLTESPLAELTAAFAATGNFSPSPSPLAHPTHKLAATKPTAHATIRMRPYTFTSPTKEVRRPRAASSAKAMRV